MPEAPSEGQNLTLIIIALKGGTCSVNVCQKCSQNLTKQLNVQCATIKVKELLDFTSATLDICFFKSSSP